MVVSLFKCFFDHVSLGVFVLLMSLRHLLDQLIRSFLGFFCLLCLAIERISRFYLRTHVHLLRILFGHVLSYEVISLHSEVLVCEIFDNLVNISQSYSRMLYTENFSDESSEIVVAIHKDLRRLFQK